jgi:chitin synthase
MESYALDATDSNFLSLLFQRKKSSSDYRALLDPSTPSYSFAIKHFGSYDTDYSIDSFLESNLDTVSPDFVHLFKSNCTNVFVAELFNTNTSYWITETHPRDSSTIIKAQLPLWPPESAENREPSRIDNEDQSASKQLNSSSKNATQTVLDQVSKGLDYLKRKLTFMQVFEVIHIQPNAQHKSDLFEAAHVVHQLSCYKIATLMNHASDAVYSYTYEQMCERYGPLIDQDGINEDKAAISEWAKSRQYTEREVSLKKDSIELSFSVWRSLENQLRALEKEVSLREKERQAMLEAEKEKARHAAMIAVTEAEEAILQETTELAAQNIDFSNTVMSMDPWPNECNPFADDYKSEFTAEDDQTFIDYQLNSFEDRKSDWYEEEQEEKVLSEG